MKSANKTLRQASALLLVLGSVSLVQPAQAESTVVILDAVPMRHAIGGSPVAILDAIPQRHQVSNIVWGTAIPQRHEVSNIVWGTAIPPRHEISAHAAAVSDPAVLDLNQRF